MNVNKVLWNEQAPDLRKNRINEVSNLLRLVEEFKYPNTTLQTLHCYGGVNNYSYPQNIINRPDDTEELSMQNSWFNLCYLSKHYSEIKKELIQYPDRKIILLVNGPAADCGTSQFPYNTEAFQNARELEKMFIDYLRLDESFDRSVIDRLLIIPTGFDITPQMKENGTVTQSKLELDRTVAKMFGMELERILTEKKVYLRMLLTLLLSGDFVNILKIQTAERHEVYGRSVERRSFEWEYFKKTEEYKKSKIRKRKASQAFQLIATIIGSYNLLKNSGNKPKFDMSNFRAYNTNL